MRSLLSSQARRSDQQKLGQVNVRQTRSLAMQVVFKLSALYRHRSEGAESVEAVGALARANEGDSD